MRFTTALRPPFFHVAFLLILSLFPQGNSRAASLNSKTNHWAFRPIQPFSAPASPTSRSNDQWVRSSIDSFIEARLQSAGLSHAPHADRRTLIRRATFDLTGLPPSPSEVEAFLNDRSTDAFAHLVDRLLSSPRYGEHWGRHWLDVVRYADTAGETADYPVPLAWRYRNYVVNAFNADKPYDQFIREQIAGDILSTTVSADRRAECLTATGYLAISRRFGFDSENYHHLTIQDTIDNVGQTFLGLSLGCARCHDHKYDPVSAADYYALYGIFDSTRYSFPGSEQKQKYRALLPLQSTPEAQGQWQSFDERLSALVRKLERNQQSVSPAVLRSLADCDGDFEMQAPAAGGSKGVLVPPWIYEGQIAVTREAQSPFANLYALGKVGASLPAGTNSYQFGQALYPVRTHQEGGTLFINLDFRLTSPPVSEAGHRFWMGSRSVPNTPAPALADHAAMSEPSPRSRIKTSEAFAFLIRSTNLILKCGDGNESVVSSLKVGEWNNLRLRVDLTDRSLSGELTQRDHRQTLSRQPLLNEWGGVLQFVGFDSLQDLTKSVPSLELDNFGVRTSEIAAPGSSMANATKAEPTMASISENIRKLAGMDGDFEFQDPDKAPIKPWGPGPNSVVKVSRASQSPYRSIYPGGSLGLRMPSGSAYNGFGQTLTNIWKSVQTEELHASFDFRVGADSPSPATWRFYLGHGAGPGPAVMFFFNDQAFFQQNQDKVIEVGRLKTNSWYHVEFTLQLKARHYTGWMGDAQTRLRFEGATPSGWDGVVDYLFIDSYGHLGGVKPELDADNLVVTEVPLPSFNATVQTPVATTGDRRREMRTLRDQMAALERELNAARDELNAAIAAGPSDMAYGVVEGTPHNARIHLRGDPEKLGAETPRGFPKILGGDTLSAEATGSGRMELAQWITRAENPLTARVIVNRIWQYHFGRGLVATPNDFGIRGLPPTHPQLLDHLAAQLIASRWSLKSMHRLIMNSAVYQQASSPLEMDGGAMSSQVPLADPENLLHSRFARRRLEAESLRDSLLLVCGDLDEIPGEGHPFPPPTSWGYTQHAPYSAVYTHNKRSIYLMSQRIKRHPFLALFDGADPNNATPSRGVSTVPTQALFFMNDPFVHEKSAHFARRLEQVKATEAEQVSLAYEWALGRRPTAVEIAEAQDFLVQYRTALNGQKETSAGEQPLAALARALFGSNEFLHID